MILVPLNIQQLIHQCTIFELSTTKSVAISLREFQTMKKPNSGPLLVSIISLMLTDSNLARLASLADIAIYLLIWNTVNNFLLIPSYGVLDNVLKARF